jgi:N-ethylmaleimide reductase
VHDEGGKIFMQLWHTGRVAQPSFGEHPLLKGSGLPLPSVSSSEMPLRHPKTGELLTAFTYAGKETCAVPRPLATSEIPRLLDDYRRACENALRAGFDGVELHAAHGYLIDQFLQDGVNKRTDEYGGTVNNRCRLLFEATGALVDIAGQGRVGVRLSPTTIDASGRQSMQYYAASSTDPDAVYEHAVGGLNRWKLAYLLLSEPRWNGRNDGDVASDPGFSQPLTNAKYRGIYDNTLMAAGGFTPASAAQAVADGTYDLVAFGRWFLSNPDLPERLRSGAPLNVYDRQTFYTPTILGKDGRKGYVDYPDMGGTIGETGKYPLMEQHRIGTSLGATPTKTEGGATSS